MSAQGVFRFVQGYGPAGYQVLARSPDLPRTVERACLDEADRWEVSRQRPGLLVCPLDVRGHGRGLLAIATRFVPPAGVGRGHWERGVVLWPGMSLSILHAFAHIVAAVPPFTARGDLGEPPATARLDQPRLTEWRTLQAAWSGLIDDATVVVTAGGPDRELDACTRLLDLVPPWIADRMFVALGLSDRCNARAGPGLRSGERFAEDSECILLTTEPSRPMNGIRTSTWERVFCFLAAGVADESPEDGRIAFWRGMASACGVIAARDLSTAQVEACVAADAAGEGIEAARVSDTPLAPEVQGLLLTGVASDIFCRRLLPWLDAHTPEGLVAATRVLHLLRSRPLEPRDVHRLLVPALAAAQLQAYLSEQAEAADRRLEERIAIYGCGIPGGRTAPPSWFNRVQEEACIQFLRVLEGVVRQRGAEYAGILEEPWPGTDSRAPGLVRTTLDRALGRHRTVLTIGGHLARCGTRGLPGGVASSADGSPRALESSLPQVWSDPVVDTWDTRRFRSRLEFACALVQKCGPSPRIAEAVHSFVHASARIVGVARHDRPEIPSTRPRS